MYADYSIRYTDDYPYGLICRCGVIIHLKKNEVTYGDNRFICPNCNNETGSLVILK